MPVSPVSVLRLASAALVGLVLSQPALATQPSDDSPLQPPPPPPLLATAPLEGRPQAGPLQRPQSLALIVDALTAPAGTHYAVTPERRALLNTIRFAEGTWARGEDIGYRILFGGSLMPHLDAHPDQVNHSGGYASAAAGAYQFMPFTWARASRALQLEGFGPHVQDQAALFLIERRGALGLADLGEFSPELAARLAPEWASFPTLAGSSYYGQPVQRFSVLRSFYEQNLSQLRTASITPQPVAALPACTPAESLSCRLQALDQLGPRNRGAEGG